MAGLGQEGAAQSLPVIRLEVLLSTMRLEHKACASTQQNRVTEYVVIVMGDKREIEIVGRHALPRTFMALSFGATRADVIVKSRTRSV